MSYKLYVKDESTKDESYDLFIKKNNINFNEDFTKKSITRKIFKSKPFKLSIALTILLLIISITIIGVNNIDNKYKHYQLYEKGNELNEIMADKNDIQGNEVGGSSIRILETLNGICLFIKEYTIFEIKDSSVDYYICGYVDSEVKEKIYKTYHLDTSQYCSTSFYYDSLFHAYTLCTSDNFLCSLDEVKRDLYFSKDDYPITWYMVQKDKDIFEYIEDKFLLGVFEIKEAIFEGIVSHKTKTKQIFCEKYEYRIEEMNPIERTTNRYVKETIYSLDYERINVNEEKKYINYCGWRKISNLDFLLEKDINISKISEIKYYNDFAYINLGDETVVNVYNEEYSFQDKVNCFYDCFVIAEELINKCEHTVYICEDCYMSAYNEKHSGCKCQDKDYLNSLKKDFKDMYEYKAIIKNTKQYYYFKLYDFLSFIEVNNHYDMYTFLNPLDSAIENF